MILAILLAFLGPAHAPIPYAVYYTFLMGILVINNIRYAVSSYLFYKKSVQHSLTDWGSFDNSTEHLIVIPNYKEDMRVIRESLDVLASHEQAVTNYRFVFCDSGYAWRWRVASREQRARQCS